ncbi:MAG: cupin domain-containing protein [Zoogloeaceae bacterium]|nr:cupin domain-containing protein [Zoogloeaceae bacterium]
MTRLDRLSALLNGFTAHVEIPHAGVLTKPQTFVATAGKHLDLHLILSGSTRFNAPRITADLHAPGALVARTIDAYQLQPQPEAQLLSARLSLSGPSGKLLLDAFSEPVLLKLDEGGDDLSHLMALAKVELSHPRCGHGALLARVGDIMLITLLRHIIARPGIGNGLLSALADPRIAQTVVAMHEQPAMPWTLESMADTAGMSRTAFSTTFRERMGLTPGNYLSKLRLGIAEQSVTAGEGLKRAAQAAGYASPAALSRALSRQREKAGPAR